jgi:prefoldin subunit 5
MDQAEITIPAAPFIENVEDFLSAEYSAESALKKMQSNYSAYKLLELKLNQYKQNLKNKLPDIEKALAMVLHLSTTKSQVSAHFELNEGLYASATLNNVQSVCLWLGANVMVEYSCEEAIELLTKNLDAAKTNLKSVEEDLKFLKDQITTTEVSILSKTIF